MRISDWSSDVCSSDLASILSRIRQCFGLVIDLPVKIGMNRVILAFRDERPNLNHATIQRIARDLDQAHPMSFSPLANEILRRLKSLDRKIGRASCRERVCQYV